MLMRHEVQFKGGYSAVALVEAIKRDVGAFGLKIAAQGVDWVLCENWVLGEEHDDEMLLVQAMQIGDSDCHVIVVAAALDETWAPRLCVEVAEYVRGLRTL
jgi:hypothetical protein